LHAVVSASESDIASSADFLYTATSFSVGGT
jgi:hypothetical protein